MGRKLTFEEEKVEEMVSEKCKCGAKDDFDCFCYMENKLRRKRLMEKYGDKWKEKEELDEMLKILFETEC